MLPLIQDGKFSVNEFEHLLIKGFKFSPNYGLLFPKSIAKVFEFLEFLILEMQDSENIEKLLESLFETTYFLILIYHGIVAFVSQLMVLFLF